MHPELVNSLIVSTPGPPPRAGRRPSRSSGTRTPGRFNSRPATTGGPTPWPERSVARWRRFNSRPATTGGPTIDLAQVDAGRHVSTPGPPPRAGRRRAACGFGPSVAVSTPGPPPRAGRPAKPSTSRKPSSVFQLPARHHGRADGCARGRRWRRTRFNSRPATTGGPTACSSPTPAFARRFNSRPATTGGPTHRGQPLSPVAPVSTPGPPPRAGRPPRGPAVRSPHRVSTPGPPPRAGRLYKGSINH